MSGRVGIVVGLLFCGIAFSGGMTPQELRELSGLNRMVWLRVPATKELPTVDGTLELEKGEWKDAVCVPGMLHIRPGILLPMECLTFITWDEKNFYLGVRTELLPGQSLRRRVRRDEGSVHRDDAIEICFDPLGRDQLEPAYYQVIYNALGFCLDTAHTVGVSAKFWDANWTVKTDYKRGMDHWDMELKIPVSSMGIKSPNRSGQTWRFLVCRDWKNLATPEGKSIWNIYSSITGWGGFVYADSYAGLVLDDSSPVVQVLSLNELTQLKFGFTARIYNPTSRILQCKAVTKVFKGAGQAVTTLDWTKRESAIFALSKSFTLKPGQEVQWRIPTKELPPLKQGWKRAWYDMVFAVKSGEGKSTYYRIQRHFAKICYKARVKPYKLPLSVRYNPVRNNLYVECDVLEHPRKGEVSSIAVELYRGGKKRPLATGKVGYRKNDVFKGLIEVPPLEAGKYIAKATLLTRDSEEIESREFTIEKLEEKKEFKWWKCKAGILNEPIPPHRSMRYENRMVITTTGRFRFDGSALPSQVEMTGKELLASPVRFACSAGGRELNFRKPERTRFRKRSPLKAKLTGRLTSEKLRIRISNDMEYDGAMKFTVDIEPRGAVEVDYLRLEIPFKEERADWLWSMALDCRANWFAVDLRKGRGKLWDSSDRIGLGMTVGSFMPQYVVSDSFRGLCWFADNDRGWVPRDDVPATEVLKKDKETVLRFNFIGKPFKLKRSRRIVFWLLGLPGRPLPENWRLYHRNAVQFGYYVGDPIVCWSPPMPKDFEKAQRYIRDGTLYNKDGSVKVEKHGGKWHPQREFAPWHDSHNWFRTPDINPKTFSYLRLECGDGSWTPTMIDYKCYLWNEYVRRTDISGVYFDTPEGMGFSFNISNGTAYIIPDRQPMGGEIQPGYRISGFREYIKRVRGIFYANGRRRPWLEMHLTHGPVVPCTPFLEIRTEGEHNRLPSARNFMRAWSIMHLRAVDVPPLYGIVTRWLGGYPWDGKVPGADPQRCKIGALILHDIFTGWSDFSQSGSIYKKQAPCIRKPPYGYKHRYVHQRLVAHGLNRSEVIYHPYWRNANLVKLSPAQGVKNTRASLWQIPSQSKVLVAVVNYNEREVKAVSVRLNLPALGIQPKADGEELVVMDFETCEPMAEIPVLDLPPLDFALLLFGKVSVSKDPPLSRLNIKGAEKYDRSKGEFTTAGITQNLRAHGFYSTEVKRYAKGALENFLKVTGAPQVETELLHLPSQGKALVVLTNRSRAPRTATLLLQLDKLGMKPQAPEEVLVVLDLGGSSILQETAYNARGEIRVLPRRSYELGKVSVSVPAHSTSLLLFSKQ